VEISGKEWFRMVTFSYLVGCLASYLLSVILKSPKIKKCKLFFLRLGKQTF
jgi:hypothetical protein